MKAFRFILALLSASAFAGGPETGELRRLLESTGEASKLEVLLDQAIEHPDPSFMPRLFQLTREPFARVRWLARTAIRAQGAPAMGPVLEYLRGPDLKAGKAGMMAAVFVDPAFHQPEAVPVLEGLLPDPQLGPFASEALGRMDLPEALQALELAASAGPGFSRDHALNGLRRAGLRGGPPLARLLQSEDPALRLAALRSAEQGFLPGFAAQAERLARLGNPWPELRGFASKQLGGFYQADLFGKILSFLPQGLRRRIHAELLWAREWENAARSRLILMPHLALMALSFFLGAMLLLGFLRPFEPYRFSLYALILLLGGLAGDVWLFIDHPWFLRLAAASRLTLLVGLFRSRRDLDPSQSDSLWASLAGWLAFLILPAFFYFSGEAWSEALRRVGARPDFALAALFLGLMVGLLLLDLRLKGGPRLLKSLRSQGWAVELLLAAFALLLAACPGRAMQEALALRDYPKALVYFLLLAPLLGLALSQLLLMRGENEKTLLWRQSPSKRLKAYASPDMLTVRLREERHWVWNLGTGHLLMAALPLMPLVDAAHKGLSWPEKGPGFLALIGLSFVGNLVAWHSMAHFYGRQLIQVRQGRVRRAHTLFGACLRGGLWKKQVPILRQGREFDAEEKQWLRDCLRRSRGFKSLARQGSASERPLSLEILSASAPASGAFAAPLRLKLGNASEQALSLQDLEQDLQDELFQAKLEAGRAQVYFSGALRDQVMDPQGFLELKAVLAAPFPIKPGMRLSLGSKALRSGPGEILIQEGA